MLLSMYVTLLRIAGYRWGVLKILLLDQVIYFAMGKILSLTINWGKILKTSHKSYPADGVGDGRARVDCNEENDLNGRMAGSCLQVYRNEIKLGLSIAKQ